MGEIILKRNELLEILHGITFSAQKTYISHELCAEVIIFTSEGTSKWQESYSEPWPAFCIKGMEETELEAIKQKIREATLTVKDITGTGLDAFILGKRDGKITWGEYFKNLLKGNLDKDGNLYVFFDSESEETIPQFFSSKEALADRMSVAYSNVFTYWEDLNDEQLQYYVEQYAGVNDFPVNHICKDHTVV